ncbi:HypC/HybG/HupF family hydrogenase formation chaperone [Acidihalobacter prosperus]|uniref:[NiFe] hydrogenase metallocenter assembly protein HypC n=1 Tax=Acidihalobacter prosperus TaxID=160660 RepID=A0A1A6C2Q3_9GAMM|nr:HypC/HybG/HupF family hydrogenase formation chaperone [Acidihalobacter prosperus]OBS08825.1 [NiFe] hydrogenase metallocenter assembly protein HypC [Acidihalobacter prosperus]
MCLGIPMRILEIDGDTAVCEAGGIRRNVSLFLLQHAPPSVGEHVIVHVGYALQTLTHEDAAARQALFAALQAGATR